MYLGQLGLPHYVRGMDKVRLASQDSSMSIKKKLNELCSLLVQLIILYIQTTESISNNVKCLRSCLIGFTVYSIFNLNKFQMLPVRFCVYNIFNL